MRPFKISIIIPIFNVEPYIADCVQSVMRQTYQGSMECILVDDGCTDDSMGVVMRRIAEYEGPIEFKVLHHDNSRGPSAARNTGMSVAEGGYLFFLDSDDWLSDDCIEKLAEPLRKKEFDMVIGDYQTVGELPYHLELSLPEGLYHESGITYTFCNRGVYVMPWNKLYRKDFLLKNHVSFQEGIIFEDNILSFELSCLEKTFYVVREVTYFYRIRENSIVTSNNQFNKLKGRVGMLQGIKEKVSKYEKVRGVYDFYMFWIKRVFGQISHIKLDSGMMTYVQEHTKQYLDVIPGVCYLHNKHNRLLYYACKNDQTYKRFWYVVKVYSNKLSGRIMRNVLYLLPYKTK